jgi:hypothetical protein
MNDLQTYKEVNEERVSEVETDFLSLLKEQKAVGEMLAEEASPIVEADPKMSCRISAS